MRGDPDLMALLRAGRPGEFAVVPPVAAEIEYGIRRLPPGRQRELLETQRDRFLKVLRFLPWTSEASQGPRPYTGSTYSTGSEPGTS